MAGSRIKPRTLLGPKIVSGRVLVGRQGRIVIPAKVRKALNVKEGDELLASAEGDQLVMRRHQDIDERLWALCRHIKGSLVDELIRERRAEAAREAKK